MFKIRIADFIIEIDNKYSFVKGQCAKYLYEGDGADLYASCTMADILKEEEAVKTDEQVWGTIGNFEDDHRHGYLESICIYRAICLQLPYHNAFVMHAAVIEVEGEAYAFAARSGTGKSTHISLWKKLLGERVQIINGDKPIIREKDGKLYAYGTPWCGKENWSRNVCAPLKGICFIERALENSISKIELGDAATRLMKQILMPNDSLGAMLTLDLLDKLVNGVSCWVLGCNISVEAAKVAYEAMSGGKYED